MKDHISIAVLSDLHFCSHEKGATHTHALVGANLPRRQNPAADLEELISSEDLRADAILTPGDLTTMSCGIGLNAAWELLAKIYNSMHASALIAATGNHDVESRDVDKAPDIWERLKLLSPYYPSPQIDELERFRYFSEHYMVTDLEWCRIVSLNTCNTHARGKDEYEKGRVTEYTVSSLTKHLNKLPRKQINILLCHHHPSALPELSDHLDDYSEMVHGAKLISELEQREENWIIIHGHKHFPNVGYAKGGSDSPVIVSAGSLSAALPQQFLATASNQFYLIDLELKDIGAMGACGRVRSWDWAKGTGWTIADKFDRSRPARILHGSGFGLRTGAATLAAKVDSAMGSSIRMEWTELVKIIPEIEYMITPDRTKLLRRLESNHNLRAASDNPNSPMELVRQRA